MSTAHRRGPSSTGRTVTIGDTAPDGRSDTHLPTPRLIFQDPG